MTTDWKMFWRRPDNRLRVSTASGLGYNQGAGTNVCLPPGALNNEWCQVVVPRLAGGSRLQRGVGDAAYMPLAVKSMKTSLYSGE
jgi:hypothetical protein